MPAGKKPHLILIRCQNNSLVGEEIVQCGGRPCPPTLQEQALLSKKAIANVLMMLLAVVLVGCSNPPENRTESSGNTPGRSSGEQANKARNMQPLQTGQSRVRPEGPGKLSAVLPSQPGERLIGATGGQAPQEPIIERISGYKTGGEYFILPSGTFPQAMAVVTLPYDYETSRDKKYPLIIVFGGAGECAKPPRSGALAWMHYYKTDEAVYTLQNNHLQAEDFRGLVKPSELDAFNTRLEKQPYAGVILACPYSPLLSVMARLETPEYESYIMDELILALKNRYRVADGSVGVDGVSMGGARSMYYGFKYPEVFSSIGSVQGAFGPYMETYRELVRRNGDILKKRAIQLVTSDKDPMAPSVEKMHQLLEFHGIKHRYLTLTGPHDYIFNQGPGVLALLVFHNQALAQRSGGPVKRE